MDAKKQLLHYKATALPEQPGVYIMKNASGEIIYIGKAKNLKNRVSQYFGDSSTHTLKVRRMVENVDRFDYIIVANEFEALALECSLIKQNKPKYNILLKDDKGFYYIRYKKDGWKSIAAVKQKADDGAEYIGPFMASEYVASAVKQANDVFMLPHCGKQFPRDIRPNSRPCLNYHIKLCSGACCGKIDMQEHNNNVEAALKLVLKGKNEIIAQFKEEMMKASERLDFETAARYRDKIRSMEKIAQKQNVVSKNFSDQDVVAVESMHERSCVCVLKFRNGDLTDTDTFIVDRLEKNAEDYSELLASYYSSPDDLPDRICIDIPTDDMDALEEYLTKKRDKKTVVYHPRSGDSLPLIEMARKNALEKLARVYSYDDKAKAALHELQELLHLDRFPEYIEAYDISNTAGKENVGGMVVFRNGRPLKSAYKRFMIKSFEGQDDFRSLAEVLTRRIREYKLDPDCEVGFGKKPDLILLDGGQGQVSAVKEVFRKMDFDVPLFGMVKDGSHRTRAIAADGREVEIKENRTVFTFVGTVQEEVHRYAISYHHKLKEKNTFVSSLMMIDGVGKKRAENLMIKFKTLSSIAKADTDEIASVPGIDRKTAENIRSFFSNSTGFLDLD